MLLQELLTRFDLVFALLDQTNAARDDMLSRHVLAQHAGMLKHCVQKRPSKALVMTCSSDKLQHRAVMHMTNSGQ